MHQIRIYGLFILLLASGQAMAMRSDSFSISHTTISLRIRNFSARTLSGTAVHRLKFRKPSASVSFDLRQMTVDSVLVNGVSSVFNRKGEQIVTDLGRMYAVGDSCLVEIHYRGIPAADPGGWGGFYFSGDYAFNLGVGFTVNPHSFGRAWFPCVDEFTMKSSYEFYIETDTFHTAACNGLLLGSQRKEDAIIWHYLETVPMSSYLVSVSVSRYHVISSEQKGSDRDYPVQLFCKPSDTLKVRSSFVKLPQAISAFEEAFGPQVYSKVGYNFVPFSGGAMEHAGNITYPAVFADGSFNFERLMAHELSHHWWGNSVTCSTEGDMWLNEGWASYCEFFFTEKIYGKQAYLDAVRANRLAVLRFAHINDGAVMGLTGIPTDKTYGNHVYKKGADVVHSLRGVTGDSVFFEACKRYQRDYRLSNASTDDLKNVFMLSGGGSRVEHFFQDWVVGKGFPHFYLEKQVHSGNGPYQLRIHTVQHPRFMDKVCSNLPVEVFFFRDRKHVEKRTILLNGSHDSFTFSFSFKPVFVCLDRDEKLGDAVTEREIETASPGVYNLSEALCSVHVKEVADTALLRVEHHWTGPEKYRVSSPYMSNYRYYSVDGIWDDSFRMDLELVYDGRQGGPNSTVGYLDHTLIFKTEDSLTVLYRAFPGDHWRVWNDLQFTYGSKNDKQGKVLVRNALRGDYVFAMYDRSLGNAGRETGIPNWRIFPNPAQNSFTIGFGQAGSGLVEISDADGKRVFSSVRGASEMEMNIGTRQLSPGVYTVSYTEQGKSQSEKLLITR